MAFAAIIFIIAILWAAISACASFTDADAESNVWAGFGTGAVCLGPAKEFHPAEKYGLRGVCGTAPVGGGGPDEAPPPDAGGEPPPPSVGGVIGTAAFVGGGGGAGPFAFAGGGAGGGGGAGPAPPPPPPPPPPDVP